GNVALAFPDLSIDAGIRRREVVERRSRVAEFHGIELSLRNATSADAAGMVCPPLTGICPEDVGCRDVCSRAHRAVSVSDNTASPLGSRCHYARVSRTDRSNVK